MTRLLLVALTVATALMPATAFGKVGDYRYCSAAGYGVTLVRSVRPDASFGYQSTIGGRIALGRKSVVAYLAWPHSPTQPARLRVVIDTMDVAAPYVPDDAITTFVGKKGDADASLATLSRKGDYQIWDLDPDALVRRFPGLKTVTMRVDPRKGGRNLLKVRVDLAAIGDVSATAAALAPTITTDPAQCSVEPGKLTTDADPALYQNCSVDATTASGNFTATTGRMNWGFPVVPGKAWLSAQVFGWQDDRPLPTAMPDNPFLWAGTSIVAQANDRKIMAVVFRAGDRSYRETFTNAAPLAWPKLKELDATGQPISVDFVDGAGNALMSGQLPAHFFAGVEGDLGPLAARLAEAMRDPIINCAPSGSIVIT